MCETPVITSNVTFTTEVIIKCGSFMIDIYIYIYISLHNINNQVHVRCQYDLVLIDKSLKNTKFSLIFTQLRNMNRK